MSPDTVLALDCAGPWLGLALSTRGEITARFVPMQKGQAEHLIGQAQDFLSDSDLSFEDLTALAVGRGPGNFTGLRIALSAARGLALGLGCPCVGVTRFEAIAARYGHEGLAVVAGPRDQYYVQDLRHDVPPALWSADDLAGLDARRLPDLAPEELAPMILRCALEALRGGGELARPSPLYIKPADAAPAAPGPRLLA